MGVFTKNIRAIIIISIITIAGILNISYSDIKNMQKNKRVKTTMADLDKIFDLEKLPEMTLSVTADEWNDLLDYFDVYAQNEKYIKGDLVFIRDGKKIRLKNIGLRVRGNSFSRKRPEGSKNMNHDAVDPDWNHAHFRLNFDKYQKQDFMGLTAMNLKWFNNDPSYVREIYSYDLFNRFGVWPALRVSYVKLYIQVKGTKKAYFGIYEMMESVDKRYLEKRFPGNDDGYLWKCLFPSTLRPGGAQSKMGVEDPDKGKKYSYDLKTNKKDLEKAKDQFSQFMLDLRDKEGKEFEKWIESAFDVDMFLRTLAVHVMLGMWDDYWNLGNNFYFYFDEKGKATFIPYDYDNTLGTSGRFDAGKQDIYNYGKMDGSRPLVEKILAIPRFRKQYTKYIVELLDEKNDYFSPKASIDRINKWHELIEEYVKNDTGQDNLIEDHPAPWGKTSYYRLWDEDPSVNYFHIRKEYALLQMGLITRINYTVIKFVVDTGKLNISHLYVKGNVEPLTFYSSTELWDNGSGGDEKSGDGIYTLNVTFTNTMPLIYRFVGTDDKGIPVGNNANWKPRSYKFDQDSITNVIRVILE